MRTLLRTVPLEAVERRRLLVSVLLALAAVLSATALLSTSGYLISRAAQRPDILALTAVITAIRALSLVRAFSRYGERLVSHDLALRVLARLRSRFYGALAPLGPTAIAGSRRGELLSRFVADVDTLQDLYLRAVTPQLVAALTVVVVGAATYLMLAAAGAVLVIALLAAAAVIPLLTGAISAAANRRQAPARSALTSELVESLTGAVELAVAGRGHDRAERIGSLSDRLTRLAARDAASGALATALSTLVTGLTIVCLLVVAIPAVHAGDLNPVLLAAIVFAAMGAFEALAPLPAAARTRQVCNSVVSRLTAIERMAPAVTDPPQPATLTLADDGSGIALELEHVAFRYGEGETWLLNDTSVLFEPGCRVAITGASGTGKSTLAQLLVRFMDPQSGDVRVGGIDARRLPLATVRAATVLISQDAHVFDTTIRQNLMLANPGAGEAALWEALEAVRLDGWAHALPDALDTVVGENGQRLSGGQRQRLTIARALVSDAPCIVLDEPTAQLDGETARALMSAIDQAAGERSLIVITHRPEGLECMRQVFELADGVLRSVESRSALAQHH